MKNEVPGVHVRFDHVASGVVNAENVSLCMLEKSQVLLPVRARRESNAS
jgi:hypothetical protein